MTATINTQKRILYVGKDDKALKKLVRCFYPNHDVYQLGNPLEAFSWMRSTEVIPTLILIEDIYNNINLLNYSNWLTERFGQENFKIVLFVNDRNKYSIEEVLNNHIVDVLETPLSIHQLEGLKRLVNFGERKGRPFTRKIEESLVLKIPLWKRCFDIIFSGLALLLLMPFLLLIGILIKMDSKGTIFYKSKRVGTGYKVFDFYKFRTMRTGADKELQNLKKELNQYQTNEETIAFSSDKVCANCIAQNCTKLVIDNQIICEQQFLNKEKTKKSAFVKLKQDPRITPLGRFLRNTSIDELPQLLNILKGDMSIVGNRPLPLYEAEQLTTDKGVQRFMAPAGLTGLWQVRKRGQKQMSEEERKNLDNEYAQNYSLWMDLQLIFQTLFVFIQRENV